ncbi:MAG: UPF0721 transmembrane protein [Planctomycetota bacterium]|nr:MAG: UPF0721 transmembrane protein [Planctomycetota bacterium]
MDPHFAFVALAALVGFAAQALSGFGGVIISLTLGALVWPLGELVPLLVPMSTLVTATIVLRHHEHVQWRLLGRYLLPCMLAGMAVGLAAFHLVASRALERAYGALVCLFALRELWRRLADPHHEPVRWTLGLRQVGPWLFAAGVVHGIYASGGPLVVWTIERLGLDRRRFRSTLCVMWLGLNLVLIATYLAGGRLGAAQLPFLGVLAPVVLLALALGEWCHARIDEHRFRLVVYALLLIGGGALLR